MAPIVNLGPDTASCGPITLDAGNPGANSYLWSTNATTQTLQVSQSGIYWVDVTDGTGTTRDSIFVTVLTPPTTPLTVDTTVCGGEQILAVTGNQDYTLWWDALNGGNVAFTGDSITLSLTDTLTLFPQRVIAANSASVGPAVPGNPSNFFDGRRGVQFDVLRPTTIEFITVIADQPTLIDIEILDNSNGLVIRDSFFVPIGNQAYEVPVFFELPTGNDYQMYLAGTDGGRLALTGSGLSYPYVLPGRIQMDVSLGGGFSFFYFFFDWKVSDRSCFSGRGTYTVNVLPTPTADLGPTDTVVCGGSLLLDATDTLAGVQYLWNTGSTMSSITATNSQLYTVTATAGICVARDSIDVTFVPIPPATTLRDTNVCGTGDFLISLPVSSASVLWYDSLTSQLPFASGNPVSINLPDSTTVFVEPINLLTNTNLGPTTLPGNANYFPGVRGVVFDAASEIIIQSVSVLIEGPVSFTLEVQRSDGSTIGTRNYQLTNTSGPNIIPLMMQIPAGTGHRMILSSATGTGLALSSGASFPYTSSNGLVTLTGSFNGGNQFFYFFLDWIVSQKVCATTRTPLQINTLPSPSTDLGPEDTTLCGGTLSLDVSEPNATYNWSNGSSNPIQVITRDSILKVEVSIGLCSVEDSIEVYFLPPPVGLTFKDTTICGIQSIPISSITPDQNIIWYDSLVGGTPFAIGKTIPDFLVEDTISVFPAGVNLRGISNVGKLNAISPLVSYFDGPRGVIFDISSSVTIVSVDVYTIQPTAGTILVENSSGRIIHVYDFSISNSGFTRTTLPVFFEMEPGSGYVMYLANTAEGALGLTNDQVNFPYAQGGKVTMTGSYLGGNSFYYYFFNWQIASGSCIGPRSTYTINVNLPLSLQDSIYACTPTQLATGTTQASSILWNTGATTPNIQVDTTGIYWVELSDQQGCTVRDSLLFRRPVLNLGNDGILCGNQLITGYGPDASFTWSTGDTLPSLQVTTPGTYFVEVIEPRGCFLRDTITVTGFDAFPLVDLGQDVINCGDFVLNAGNPGLTHNWATVGSSTVLGTNQTYTVTGSGTYVATVINANGCTSSDTIGVTINRIPNAQFSVNVQQCVARTVNRTGFANYLWNFGDGTQSTAFSPQHTYRDTGTYTVVLIASSREGCGSDTATQIVQITDCSSISVEDLADPSEVTIFPNPANERLQVEVLTHDFSGEAILRLTDLFGKSLSVKSVFLVEGQLANFQIRTSEIPNGIYNLSLQMNQQIKTFRVQVLH
ncbi:MAG: PKD domain-containing protein [Bacteroidota bacterium]